MECSLVYFSPTATTRKVLEAIAKGMDAAVTTVIDLTLPHIRQQAPEKLKGNVLLAGAPVYAGRLPKDAAAFFKTLKASGTRVVPVVLYGNRAFEDALVELKDILTDGGFVPVAAGAFIGEHSFSTKDAPIAPDRPDQQDLDMAFAFGKKIAALLEQQDDGAELPIVDVPGNFPYKEVPDFTPHPFIDVIDGCTACDICLAVCPADAIDRADGFATIDEKCFHCCACIKACPEAVRIMKDGMLKERAKTLVKTCSKRKEPEYFLCKG